MVNKSGLKKKENFCDAQKLWCTEWRKNYCLFFNLVFCNFCFGEYMWLLGRTVLKPIDDELWTLCRRSLYTSYAFPEQVRQTGIGFYWFRNSFPRSDAFHHILFLHSICIFIRRDGTKHPHSFSLETISHLGKAGNFITVAHCIEIANGDQAEACYDFPQSAPRIFELLQ